jgi:uncharacterized protein YukE
MSSEKELLKQIIVRLDQLESQMSKVDDLWMISEANYKAFKALRGDYKNNSKIFAALNNDFKSKLDEIKEILALRRM